MKILFMNLIFLVSLIAFWKIFVPSGILKFVTREIQVNALWRKLRLPPVKTSELGNFKRIVCEHAFASLLFGLDVMAVDFPASLATLIFETVLPEIEIRKTLCFFVICWFFKRSRGSTARTFKSEWASASIAAARESPLPQNIEFLWETFDSGCCGWKVWRNWVWRITSLSNASIVFTLCFQKN